MTMQAGLDAGTSRPIARYRRGVLSCAGCCQAGPLAFSATGVPAPSTTLPVTVPRGAGERLIAVVSPDLTTTGVASSHWNVPGYQETDQGGDEDMATR